MNRDLPGLLIRNIPQAFISFDANEWAFSDGTDFEQAAAAQDLNINFNKFVNSRAEVGTIKNFGLIQPTYDRQQVLISMEKYLKRHEHVGATQRATREQLKYALDMVYGKQESPCEKRGGCFGGSCCLS